MAFMSIILFLILFVFPCPCPTLTHGIFFSAAVFNSTLLTLGSTHLFLLIHAGGCFWLRVLYSSYLMSVKKWIFIDAMLQWRSRANLYLQMQ